jgi:hypothetical protein
VVLAAVYYCIKTRRLRAANNIGANPGFNNNNNNNNNTNGPMSAMTAWATGSNRPMINYDQPAAMPAATWMMPAMQPSRRPQAYQPQQRVTFVNDNESRPYRPSRQFSSRFSSYDEEDDGPQETVGTQTGSQTPLTMRPSFTDA